MLVVEVYTLWSNWQILRSKCGNSCQYLCSTSRYVWNRPWISVWWKARRRDYEASKQVSNLILSSFFWYCIWHFQSGFFMWACSYKINLCSNFFRSSHDWANITTVGKSNISVKIAVF